MSEELTEERRKENKFSYSCLTKIKENLDLLTKEVIIIKEKQLNVLEYIAENKQAIIHIEEKIQDNIGKCPYEKQIQGIITQCAVCLGSKKTWSSVPMLIQLFISVITIAVVLYKLK